MYVHWGIKKYNSHRRKFQLGTSSKICNTQYSIIENIFMQYQTEFNTIHTNLIKKNPCSGEQLKNFKKLVSNITPLIM